MCFFLTSKPSESKRLTRDYCKALLDEAEMKEKVKQYEEVQKNGGVFSIGKKDFSFLDVANCKQVTAALKESKQAWEQDLRLRLVKALRSSHQED